MRVFLDTNVLVSAFTTRGICADILREVLTHKELLVCRPLIDEVNTVLTTKFGLPVDVITDIIHFLKKDTVFIQHPIEIQLDINDKDDIVILGYALGGQAAVFVTGDKEVQILQKIKKTEIISPREYWNIVRKAE